jgi:hypothetical protein
MPAAGPRRRRPHGVGGRTLRGGSHLTEVQARAALRAFQAVGDIEQWIAEQWWERLAGGWRVRGQFQRWSFEVLPVRGGVRVVMGTPGERLADWIVPTGSPY